MALVVMVSQMKNMRVCGNPSDHAELMVFQVARNMQF